MAWSPLNVLVTLDTARAHIRRPDIYPDPEHADLELKLYIAHEAVIDYVSQRIDTEDEPASDWLDTVAGWTASTAPARVKGAIIAQFAFLTRFRGDDEQEPNIGDGEVLCPAAKRNLYRYRDPAIR